MDIKWRILASKKLLSDLQYNIRDALDHGNYYIYSFMKNAG